MSVKSHLIVRNVENMISKDLGEDVQKVFNEIAETTNAQSFDALMFNGTVIILGNKKVTAQSKINITNPRILTDHALKVEKELQHKIRQLKVDYELNQAQTEKLVDSYNAEKKRLKNNEIELLTKKEMLERLAVEIKEKSVEEKLLDLLSVKHDELYKVLDKFEVNFVHISEEVKKDTVGMNDNLCIRLQEFSKEIMEDQEHLV
ncbi:hypothetical protein [Sporosarcina sp. SAFN-015]|uniref:hypothetical protein n=1 Tax=Sporosarcina sp. SAFN-015 TaxID=3387274 RepID=UPI003F7E7232